MAKKTIEVPSLVAKQFCDMVLKWLEKPENKEWLEREYPNLKQQDANQEEIPCK